MNHSEAAQLDAQYYMNTFGPRLPIMPVRGEGAVLYDDTGAAYVDLLAGIAVNALGYGHPALTKAVTQQAEDLLHCCNYFYTPQQARLAEALCKNSCADRVFFCNSGAEANEAAIKLARAYYYRKGEPRFGIISANNSFHGRTLATVTATAQKKYQEPFAPLPAGFSYVPYGDADALKEALWPSTAAVILEPIQGEGGVIEGGKSYLKAVRDICDQTGTLLIFDEVQCGMGRTGKLFAFENYGVEPDIFTLAKALGGGVPIGAVLCKEFCSAFVPGDHGTTFGGNPLACAAALAVLGEMTKEGFLDSVAEKGELLKDLMRDIKKKYPALVLDVRGRGLMIGVQLDEKLPVKEVQLALIKEGFIAGTAGGNVLRLVPPLVIEEAQLQAFAAALDKVIGERA